MTTRRAFLKALGFALGAVGLGTTALAETVQSHVGEFDAYLKAIKEAYSPDDFLAPFQGQVTTYLMNRRTWNFYDEAPGRLMLPKMTRAKRKAMRARRPRPGTSFYEALR